MDKELKQLLYELLEEIKIHNRIQITRAYFDIDRSANVFDKQKYRDLLDIIHRDMAK